MATVMVELDWQLVQRAKSATGATADQDAVTGVLRTCLDDHHASTVAADAGTTQAETGAGS